MLAASIGRSAERRNVRLFTVRFDVVYIDQVIMLFTPGNVTNFS
jgi:hypothetical protein